MYANILLPTDGSDGARRGVDAGLRLAEEHDATVHALFVVDERHVTREYDHVVEDAERRAEAALDDVGGAAAERGLSVEKHVRWGVPHAEIVAAIDAYDADLVVMATHGRTGLDRLVNLGSTTERVVRAAPVQVLTVPVERGSDVA
ncbi:universal stress protein [Halorarum halobium]|uniref:universal stress protein n=1 Tax=Halorarum halobium TaxID=3075121 RepID=UPI0028B23BF0|nr:universal stress protein [Halobaculum sp. XH14]